MTEDKEEEIAASVDRFNDSYARDTNIDELKDVRTPSASNR
jgi:DNA ligase-4